MEVTSDLLYGPYAGLALALLFLGLFYTGKILPRNAVPREDYEEMKRINSDNAAAVNKLTEAMNGLVLVVKYQQRNGG